MIRLRQPGLDLLHDAPIALVSTVVLINRVLVVLSQVPMRRTCTSESHSRSQ